ncbi:MAG: orotidine 5'-phosphate decarboxylase / HUMPS family protein [Candidatus Hermodarchaeota archaeon]
MSTKQAHKKGKQKPRLQVALDFENLEDALAISKEVAPFVDILEAGTPLIKSEGIRATKALKDAHPDKLICADLKTADAGYLEVKMAAKAKADIITILADAYDITIIEALRAANDFGVEIMADLITCRSQVIRLASLIDLKYEEKALDYALVHSGLDRQASRRTPFWELESVVRLRERPKLAVAGGIRVTDIAKLLTYPLNIIIVGGGITRAKDPQIAAEKIRKAIDKYPG